MTVISRWLVLTLLTTWVATCGQKGPLELPAQTTGGTTAVVNTAR